MPKTKKPEMADVTEMQRRVYDALIVYRKSHGGNSPSYRKLQDILKLRSATTVSVCVLNLIAKGYLDRIDGELIPTTEISQWASPHQK